MFNLCMPAFIPKEPVLPSPLPTHPWEKVATITYYYLLELKGKPYLLVVDYYCYHAVIQLTTSASVISSMESIFYRHGIPLTVVINNGPQYNSAKISDFASSYGFNHVTSSPYYFQSNGLVEWTVSVKGLLEQSNKPYLAHLQTHPIPMVWDEYKIRYTHWLTSEDRCATSLPDTRPPLAIS